MTTRPAARSRFWRLARSVAVLSPLTSWPAPIQAQRADTPSWLVTRAAGIAREVRDATASAIRLELNIPAYRLDVFVRDEPVRSFRVGVGMPNFPTPRGTFSISQLQWNPWWVPPKSDWAKEEKKTPPGPRNPMGKVKLAFRSPYLLHGTPDESSLGKPSSHGCVRLANKDATALALLIQREVLGATVSDSVAAIALPTRRTLVVDLRARIGFSVRYDLVELGRDTLFVYPDPYGLGTSLVADAMLALRRSGRDTADIDFLRLRRMTGYPRAREAFALRSLLGKAGESGRFALPGFIHAVGNVRRQVDFVGRVGDGVARHDSSSAGCE